MSTEEKFDEWALVDLFGHAKIVGRVSEATIGGCSFIRVDVPATDGRLAFTKFFGNGAIYSMSPVSEGVAMSILKELQHAPVNVWVPGVRFVESKSDPPQREVHRDWDEAEDEDDDCPI